jgi:hypothetical protein
MRVYEAIFKGLEGIGVQAAFGGAGENTASLMLALKHPERIRPIMVRHEPAAAFVACGYAMYVNRLGSRRTARPDWWSSRSRTSRRTRGPVAPTATASTRCRSSRRRSPQRWLAGGPASSTPGSRAG